jgi:hypothetical protein
MLLDLQLCQKGQATEATTDMVSYDGHSDEEPLDQEGGWGGRAVREANDRVSD